jgi:hypothetical protein
MDVILHLGAHRTGSTTFQSYMRRSSDELSQQGVGYWGPLRTRKGLFAGLIPTQGVGGSEQAQMRAEGRVKLHLGRSAQNGVRKLVVSDENMIGSVRQNLRSQTLYPAIGERMARFARAFEGRLSRVALSIRAQDLFWSSCLAYGVERGHPMMGPDSCASFAASKRSWRDVITDLACALPDTQIQVLPFERYQGQPDVLLEALTQEPAPTNKLQEWLNRAPRVKELREILDERGEIAGLQQLCGHADATRWLPFDAEQCAQMREAYADDLHWLISGADGLAKLTEQTKTDEWTHTRTGNIPRFGSPNKGQGYDKQERHVAKHC